MNHMKDKLQAIVGACFKENEVMAKHTNFRIGGPARWFVEVKSVDELKAVLDLARDQNVPTFVFGGGSNMLVSDAGFDGLVIKIALRDIQVTGTRVRAEAGALSSALARTTAKAGLAGLTWAISLPGTVGGAVRGNAGCFGGEMKDHFVEAEVLRDGEVITLTKDELAFSYRESAIKHNSDIVLSATFELEKGDPTELQKELDEKLSKRKSSQPLDAGSAGCLFKNYEISDEAQLQRLRLQLDIPVEMSQSRRLSAGWLIDQFDLKGTQVGGAKISHRHGNFVVNTGSATADDVVQLIAIVKTRARNEFGIQLQEEVELVGFSSIDLNRMSMRLTTLKSTNMDLTDAIRAYVNDKVEQLRKLCGDFDPADDLKVEVGKSTRHHVKGPYYRAEMHLVLPGKEMRAEYEGEDLYEAIDNVKDQLRRQIKDYKDRLKDKSQRAARPGKG